MKKREPKPMKPVKAWALVDEDGKASASSSGSIKPMLFPTRSIAESVARLGERIARVVITEAPQQRYETRLLKELRGK